MQLNLIDKKTEAIMQAGRELDCLIAEKIFGYIKTEITCGKNDFFVEGTELMYWIEPNKDIPCVVKRNSEPHEDLLSNRLPHYSTNLKDAWLLVNWMIQEKNIHFHLNWIPSDNEWVAGGGWIEGAETPEMAICKIALKIAEA